MKQALSTISVKEPAQLIPVVQMLVLRGVPVQPSEYGRHLSERKSACLLLAWAEAELHTRQEFITLVLGCGVHGSCKAPPAKRSYLAELRGGRNTEARMCIAQSLGVRIGVEARHLRRAAAVWREIRAG